MVALEVAEMSTHLGVADGFARVVHQQILLRDIRHIVGVRVLGQQMVKGLVFARTQFFWDRHPPFLGVVELGVDIKHHAPKREQAVFNDLTKLKFGFVRLHGLRSLNLLRFLMLARFALKIGI